MINCSSSLPVQRPSIEVERKAFARGLRVKKSLSEFGWLDEVVSNARDRHNRLWEIDGDIFELTFTYYFYRKEFSEAISLDIVFTMNDPDPKLWFDDEVRCDIRYLAARMSGSEVVFSLSHGSKKPIHAVELLRETVA